MTWTYDGAPGTSTPAQRRDAVRLLIGDTNNIDQLLTDEAIAFFLSQGSNNVYKAAALAARSIAAKFSQDVDAQFDSVSSSESTKSTQYYKLAAKLEAQASSSGAMLGVRAGGIKKSVVNSVKEDSDRIKPAFAMGEFDNPPNRELDDDYIS